MHRLAFYMILSAVVAFGAACTGIPQQVEIRSDEVAVVEDTESGDILASPLLPGTHTISALTQAVTYYPTFAQNYTFSPVNRDTMPELGAAPLQVTAGDGTALALDLSVVFRFDEQSIVEMHRMYAAQGEDVRASFVNPTTQQVVQQVLSGYNAADIVDGRRREVTALIEVDLRRMFEQAGLILDRVTLSDVRRL